MKALSEYFERKTRDNGETFYSLTDDRPDWLHEAVYEAHEDEFPNDWRYRICASIADEIEELDEDRIFELADSLVDIYNSDRLAWLAGDLGRVGICEDACRELGSGSDDILTQIAYGQYVTIERMAGIMLAAYTENVTADED